MCETGWFHALIVTPGSSSGTGFDGFYPSTLGSFTADLSDLVSIIFGIFTPKIGEDEPILTSIFFKGIGEKPLYDQNVFQPWLSCYMACSALYIPPS